MIARRQSKRQRWPLRQRLKNDALYGLMRLGFKATELLPLRGFLRLFGRLAPYMFVSAARRARHQLQTFLPDHDAVKLTRAMFVHFAESLWELSRMQRWVPELDDNARRVLDAVLAEGKGAMVITGHIGNWELLGHATARAGYPFATVAKPSYDPRITRWLDSWRSSCGMQIVWSDEANPGKTILSVLRRNWLMAFLIDQNTKAGGELVPFFGQPAYTSTTPAAIALRTRTPVVFCWHRRCGDGHRITFERLNYTPTGDRQRDILALTARFNERLEQAIREAPEQWVWLHQRWGDRDSNQPAPLRK